MVWGWAMKFEDELGWTENFTQKLPALSEEELELLSHPFREMRDGRDPRNTVYGFFEMVVMMLFSTLGGADGPYAMSTWCQTHAGWLSTFLNVTRDMPRGQTFANFLAALEPKSFSQALCELTESLHKEARKAGRGYCDDDEADEANPRHGVIAVDGKRLRRTFDKVKDKSALHLLSAFSTEMGLVLGQKAVPEGSNEITVLPGFLKLLDLKGKTVTIDAMGCQYKICDQIIRQGGDFVIGLKQNQKTLFEYAETRFRSAERRDFHSVKGEPLVHGHHDSHDKGHGRIEKRIVTTLAPSDFFYREHAQWKSIKSLVQVRSERTMTGTNTSHETRFYISSFAPENAALIAASIRAHWMVENTLHWTLDMTFKEDDSRARKNHIPQNLAALRRTGIGILKNDKTPRLSLKMKRMKCGWDPHFIPLTLGFS